MLRMFVQGEEGGDHTAYLGADTLFNVHFTDQFGAPVALGSNQYALIQLFNQADRAATKLRELAVTAVAGLESAGYGTFKLDDTESTLVARGQVFAYGLWVDDSANATKGQLQAPSILAAGANYSKPPIITLTPVLGGSGGALTAHIKGGAATGAATVTAGGANYVAPTITFNTPPGGIAATGSLTLTGDVVTGCNISYAGMGYTDQNPPVGTISDSTGSGAAVSVQIRGVVYQIDVTAGSNYKLPPTITVATDTVGGDTTGSGFSCSVSISRGDVKISETPSSITLK